VHWWFVNGGLPGIQARYLYPGLLGTIAVACVGAGTLLRGKRNVAPLIGFVVAMGLQVWSIRLIFRTSWWPYDGVTRGLHGIAHWSPWPPIVTAAPFVATLLLGLWGLVLCTRSAFARSAPEPLVQQGEPAT
jgi:hypothetical protein